MDFELSDDQRALADLTRRIVEDEVTPKRLAEVETRATRHDPELWSALATAGVLAAPLPAAAGGDDGGLLAHCAVSLELGRQVAPVPYLESITVAADALAEAGRTDDAARIGRGELLATFAAVEAGGSFGAVPATTATRDGDTWVLRGGKALVPFFRVCDLVLVTAATDDGAALFALDADAVAAGAVDERIVDGDTVASLNLDGVRVGDDARLGGPELVHRTTSRAVIGTCARQVGVLERALELTAEYARERTQFGKPIGAFQAVAQRLADGFIDVEAARLTMWEAAWREAEGLPADAEVAVAKFWAADAGHRVAHTAVHVHGGAGIDVEAPTHRYFTAAKRAEFTLGHATDHLLLLGAQLADEDPTLTP